MIEDGSEIEIICSKDINLFLPLMRDITDLEERFLLAMLRWCGYGRPRHTPLKFWEVYTALIKSKPVGVSGLYQNQNTPAHIGWVGWLGVIPQYRNSGIGTRLIDYVARRASAIGMSELMVYTDDDNCGAIDFYQTVGFCHLGRAIEEFPSDDYEIKNIVMRKIV